jgi:hypothetical protein
VDGYSAHEYDDFHWDLIFGSLLHVGIAALLLWVGTKVDGPAVGLAGFGGRYPDRCGGACRLGVQPLASVSPPEMVEKVIMWTPSFTVFASWMLLAGVIAGTIEFVAQLFGGSAGLGCSSPPGGGQRGAGPAVAADGLYVIDAASGSGKKLTDDARELVWSPDGSRIAFESVRDGGSEIYVMNAEGSDQRRLTSNGGAYPAWSPDGSRIAFASGRGGDSEIYVMNADGTGLTNLTSNPAGDHDPDWSP